MSIAGHSQPSGMGNGNHAIAGQAVVSVPSSFQPAGEPLSILVMHSIVRAIEFDNRMYFALTSSSLK